jgi:PAS domain S-box-containing protein
MTVRNKIFSILFGVVGLFLLAIFLLTRLFMENNNRTQEEIRVRDNLERVLNTLKNEQASFARFTTDYSVRDDAAAFVQNPSPAFIKSNLAVSAYVVNHCYFIVYLNTAGRIVFQKAYDDIALRDEPIPDGLAAHLAPGSLLLRHESPTAGINGFLVVSGRSFMIGSRPVINSNETGPVIGTLLTGLKFDRTYVEGLSRIVRLPLVLLGPGEAAGRTEAVPGGPPTDQWVRIVDNHTIEGGVLLRDVYGRPAFVLKFSQNRVFYAQYRRARNFFLVAFALFALAALLIGRAFIDRMVTSRLSRMDRFLRETESSGDLTRRVEVRGTDELSALGRAVNGMLDALNRQVSEIRAAEDAVKKSEAKYHGLFEASTDAAFLETLDGRIFDCNPAAAQLLGYSREELLRMNVADLLPAEVKKQLPEWSALIAASGSAFLETVNVAKNGERIPIEVSVRLARIGEADYAVTFVHDMRKRKKDEKIRQAVFEISEAASTADDLDELYRLIHKAVTDIIPTRNFIIALYDAETDRLSFPFFIDEFDEVPDPRPLGRGLTGYILRRGEPLLASRADIEALVRAGELEVGGTMPVVWLGVPLKTEAAAVGVMIVQSYQTVRLFDDEEKAVLLFMSSQVAMAIERVRARERLHASLQEKEALLREVHHRVKNNMQIISSLFNLQAGEVRDPRAIEKFREGQARIRSMALIHEKLYQSKDLARINFADYIRSLAVHIFHFWKVDNTRIKLETNLEDVFLDINTAIPCGLIVNELLSNAVKHAFPDGRSGAVRLSLHLAPGREFTLQVHDDGIGLPAGVDPGRTETLGLQIIGLLIRQLDGTLSIDRTAGTSFSIRFRELRYKARI